MAGPLGPTSIMDQTASQARYGVAVLKAIASQGGCGFDETSPGEDYLAVDASLIFPEGAVRLQVKTTHTHSLDDGLSEIRHQLKEGWIEKWTASLMPVYYVVVVVPSDHRAWLAHEDSGTLMTGTAAYWSRFDAADFVNSKTMVVPKSQRLTADTLPGWQADLLALFTGPAVDGD